ncbi:glutaredoxin family protein [Cellulomonas sp. SG140]|uniref:glutaredoxin family protein n=1 Tax=Cellulomonas sp. SG140 TaxID=2976536 RepID=UPI0021E95B41|nr:glutaredoxin family protein [Cellulomonas sp. SG140]
MSSPRVVLYGRVGCHLCVEARVVVADVCARTGTAWTEVDVDDAPPAGGRDLLEEYGELVPVVEVDGVRHAWWRVDGEALRRALVGR